MSAQIAERFSSLECLTHTALVQMMLAINNHIDFQDYWLDGQAFGNPFANILTDERIELNDGELATTMDDDGRLVFIGMLGGKLRVVYESYLPLDESVTLVSLNEPEFNDLIECDERNVSLLGLKIFLHCFENGESLSAQLEELIATKLPPVNILHDQDTNEHIDEEPMFQMVISGPLVHHIVHRETLLQRLNALTPPWAKVGGVVLGAGAVILLIRRIL